MKVNITGRAYSFKWGTGYLFVQCWGANRRLDRANANLLPYTRYFHMFDPLPRLFTPDNEPNARHMKVNITGRAYSFKWGPEYLFVQTKGENRRLDRVSANLLPYTL